MSTTTYTRKNQQTGTLITVISAANAHLCDGAGTTKWYAICEDHNCLCGFSTKKLATWHAADPAGWCEDCSNLEPIKAVARGIARQASR